ncbi:hypothetical protein [Undibacterium sp. Xuan67W]|uniref:hypothetical protein n=1 Tax=Undibacterium sp. Xuan67W TaxID=3413057 RepID=UPI003BF00F46
MQNENYIALGVMSNNRETYIAGKNTRADWIALRDTLIVGVPNGWDKAFTEFFEARLKLRYLDPIQVLQDKRTSNGEGFSIVAIQCSLIEFFESMEQGKNYRHCNRGEQPAQFEYSKSKKLFVKFLSTQPPFSEAFSEGAAEDFYANVRCGLVHEARTKNGWRILANDTNGRFVSVADRIVYRNDFQLAIKSYVRAYGQKLPNDPALQEAFIRKFNSLTE